MIPKGKLIIIGGHENKEAPEGQDLKVQKRNGTSSHFEILGKLISTIPRNHHIIEIIASASSIPEEMETMYINSYKNAGFTHVGFIKVETKEDAEDTHSIERIKNAHAVFFTGGDQIRLLAMINQTAMLKVIVKKYHNDQHFIVAGTSAGAMVIPEVIITGGVIGSVLLKGDIQMTKGFGLISNVIVDTHFIKRGRFARLAHAVALNPSCLGFGLEEDTALMITQGNIAECIGSGMVLIIDGNAIEKTNIAIVDEVTPVVVENLKVSILAEGSCYSILKRRMI
jgi:cyanophycinase